MLNGNNGREGYSNDNFCCHLNVFRKAVFLMFIRRLFCLSVLMFGLFLCVPVYAEGSTIGDLAIEDENGNLIIYVTTNLDVDSLLMTIDDEDTVEIGSETAYRDEEIFGNNQTMDLNGDHYVNSDDVDIMYEHLHGGECIDMSSTIRCSHCGATDVNGNGSIDTTDLEMLQAYIDGVCEQDDCYFTGTRVNRTEYTEFDGSSGYLWRIYYTPIKDGVRTITFVPRSYVSDDNATTREGESKTIQVHAEEYKNPEIIKAYSAPTDQDKYLVNYKSGVPVSLYVVTPLETDYVELDIQNEITASDYSEVTLTEWDSIDYDTSQKYWKYDYVTDIRGWRTVTATGYGLQSDDSSAIVSDPVEFRVHIIDPLVVSGVSISSYLYYTTYYYITHSGSYTDAEGVVQSYSYTTQHVLHNYYMNTARVTCNEDTDYATFSGMSGGNGSVYSYAHSGSNHVFTSSSWVTVDSPASGGSATAHESIGEAPDVVYEYDVSFFPGNENAAQTITVEENALISKPVDPVWSGHVFLGWFKDDRGIEAWDFASDQVTQTTCLYGVWADQTYTMSFNTSGGSSVGDIQVACNGYVSSPGASVKDGYVFSGWYKNSACTVLWDFSSDQVTSDVTLYAKWVPVEYVVQFDTLGGNVISAISVQNGADIPDTLIPVKPGYVFSGWYKDEALTDNWGVFDRVDSDLTVYAKWDIAYYDVVFESNGGTSISTITCEYGTRLSQPSDPVRSGYVFSGWFTNVACTTPWDFTSYKVTADITLYAGWIANPATISFDTGCDLTVSSIYGSLGDSIVDQTLAVLVRDNYVFDGWFTDAVGGTQVSTLPSTFEVESVTYYAHWTAGTVTISFDVGDGASVASFSGTTGDLIADRSIPESTLSGYALIGFYATADFSGNVLTELPETYPSNDTVYYARWEPKLAKISFDSDGGSIVSDYYGLTDQTISDRTLPSVEKSGFILDGWYSEPNGAGIKLSQLPFEFSAGETVYYAHWIN